MGRVEARSRCKRSKSLEEISQALESTDEETIWKAAVAASELAERGSFDAWKIVLKHGVSPNEETRMAVAVLVMEELLRYHFATFFPLVEKEIMRGNRLLGYTFIHSWKVGEAKLPWNAIQWDKLHDSLHRQYIDERVGDASG